MSDVRLYPLNKIAALSQKEDKSILVVTDGTGSDLEASTIREALDLAGHIGVPPTRPESILFRDLGGGDNVNIAAAGTRAVDPGPGTITVATLGGNSTARYENGRLYLTAAGTGSVHAIAHTGLVNITAGLTLVCRIIPAATPGQTINNSIGFNHNTTGFTPRRGNVQITSSRTSGDLTLSVSNGASASDDSSFAVGAGIIRPGEEIAVAVHHKSLTEQEYYIQGGQAADFGAELGSENWYLIGRTSVDNTGQTAYPGVGVQFAGTAVIRSLELFSDWSPSPRCQTFDLDRAKIGVHIPTLERDPATGLMVHAWNNGESHWSTGQTAIRASVKLASGQWSAPQTLIAALPLPQQLHIATMIPIGGVLNLLWIYAADRALTPNIIYRAPMTINSTTGAITLGASVVIDIPAYAFPMNRGVVLPSGRVLIPSHNASSVAYVSYTDNGGATWTHGVCNTTPSLVEGGLIVEDDGAVGQYYRPFNGQSSVYYQRCADPNAATLVWSTPVKIDALPNPIVPVAGSRVTPLRLSNGRKVLIGNDSKIARREVAIWEIGDNGEVLDKVRIGNVGRHPSPVSGEQIFQYPMIAEDGDDLLIAYSHQPTGGASTSASCIRVHAWRWTDPLAREAGGTGRRDRDLVIPTARQPRQRVANMDYAATMTLDMSLASLFYVTLTGTPATGFAAPLNPLPWEELTLVIIQGGSGSYTAAFNAIYEFGGVAATWQTAVGAANILRAIYNPIQNKWRVTGFL